MKLSRLGMIFVFATLLSACGTSLSETALQTAVSEAIMTSSAGGESDQGQIAGGDPAENTVLKSDFDQVEAVLKEAQIELTQQASKINELQTVLDALYPLLTPSNTTEPPTPTNTPQSTATLSPSATPTISGGLLFNQKYVVAVGNIPIYTYTKENDAGYPIMKKVEPIQKFGDGQKIIVNLYPVRADGGLNFYLVIGPQHGGFYINVDNVKDYTGQ
jgi:hypothetical protein